ncbi:hypothetical protein AUP68_09209 [Ilyonectria robusta]
METQTPKKLVPPEICSRRKKILPSARYVATHRDTVFQDVSFEDRVFISHFFTVYALRAWNYTEVPKATKEDVKFKEKCKDGEYHLKKFDFFDDWQKLCQVLTGPEKELGALHFATKSISTVSSEEWIRPLLKKLWAQCSAEIVIEHAVDGDPSLPILNRNITQLEQVDADYPQLHNVGLQFAMPNSDLGNNGTKKRKLTSNLPLPESGSMQLSTIHNFYQPPSIRDLLGSEGRRPVLSGASRDRLDSLGSKMSKNIKEGQLGQQEDRQNLSALRHGEFIPITRAVSLHLPPKIGHDMMLEFVVASDYGRLLTEAKLNPHTLTEELGSPISDWILESTFGKQAGIQNAVDVEPLVTGDFRVNVALSSGRLSELLYLYPNPDPVAPNGGS